MDLRVGPPQVNLDPTLLILYKVASPLLVPLRSWRLPVCDYSRVQEEPFTDTYSYFTDHLSSELVPTCQNTLFYAGLSQCCTKPKVVPLETETFGQSPVACDKVAQIWKPLVARDQRFQPLFQAPITATWSLSPEGNVSGATPFVNCGDIFVSTSP